MIKKTFSILSIITLVSMMISCDNSVNKMLRDTSNEINKTCPQTLDKYTVLNTTTVIDESFMYNYTMDKQVLYDYGVSKSYWLENQVSNLTNFYCTDPNFKWKGLSFNGDNLTEGVYYYFMNATGQDGQLYEKKGSISLFF